jgi:hypothetical protein
MDHPPSQQGRQTHSQFQLLAQRRFAPYFIVTLFGAFNDNVFRQAIIGLLGVLVLAGAMDSSTRGIYTQLVPAQRSASMTARMLAISLRCAPNARARSSQPRTAARTCSTTRPTSFLVTR